MFTQWISLCLINMREWATFRQINGFNLVLSKTSSKYYYLKRCPDAFNEL